MVSAKSGNSKRKHKTFLTLFDLNILLNSERHQMLSKLASLSISSLRKLDDKANKFYDRKHDLSLLNVILNMLFVLTLILKLTTLHFIKIPFINQGIEFIDLPSIF